MAKYLEWEEPIDGETPTLIIINRMKVEDAIAFQKRYALKEHRYVYTSDEEAMHDFIAVHWAFIKEYD